MIQQGQPDPTGTNQKVWLSADRDIAVMFPAYVARALRLTSAQLKLAAAPDSSVYHARIAILSNLAERLRDFTNGSTGEGAAANVHELAVRVGFLQGDECDSDTLLVRSMFAEQLMRVVFSAYFYGVRMSLHAGERAVNREDLELAVKEVMGVI